MAGQSLFCVCRETSKSSITEIDASMATPPSRSSCDGSITVYLIAQLPVLSAQSLCALSLSSNAISLCQALLCPALDIRVSSIKVSPRASTSL